MASTQVSDPQSKTNQSHSNFASSWLVMLGMVLGCDQTMLVGSTDQDGGGDGGGVATGSGAGGQSAVSPSAASKGGAGGAGGLFITLARAGGSAGTSTTMVGVVGGTGGQPPSPDPIPAGCAPISTVPGVVDPCGHAFGVAYSPDGQLLAVGGDGANPSIHLWRLSDGMLLPDLQGQTFETTYALAFSPDGKTLAAGGYRNDPTMPDQGYEDSLARVWDVATGALIVSLPVNSGWYVDSVAFTRDGTLLATGGASDAVEIWRVADWTRVLSIAITGTAHNIHFSPDDSKLIIANYNDGKARAYSVATGELVLGPLDVAQEMADAEFSPDGTQVATTWQPSANAGGPNQVRIYDAATGTLEQSLSGHTRYISQVVWIDQNRLVSGDWDGLVILWTRDASGAFSLGKSWSTGGQSLGIGVSPDETTIVTGGGDLTTGTQGFVFLTL